ncbi:MAG: zinc-binding dehydrogenase, partial [Anaerolineae bacterium]|nr:zinc-binding dehydrogenase [Anaerolineae bacterium]
ARALSPECHITAMARYPQQVEMARKLGADEVVTGEDPYEATARITGGKLYTGMFNARMVLGGFDVVYDCVGSEKTVQDSLRWARAGVWDADNNNVPVVKLFLFRPANRDVRETIVAGARKLGRFIFDREVDIRWCASMVPLTERTAGSMMSPLKDCPFQDEPGRFAAQSELV